MIAEQVRPLESESPQLSLANLWEGKMFNYPAMHLLTGQGEIGPFPLVEGTGSADIIRVTSNRRVVKLLEELGAMPESEAARLISEQIMASLEPYREDCDRYLELLADLPNLGNPVRGISYRITSVDDPPDAHWMRASLISLVFIAGNLELTDARDAVLTVAYEAVTQRETFYDYENTGLRMEDAHYALAGIGLYNRSLLATGLIGVGAASDAAAATLEASGKDWIEMRLTPYDAEVSTYDQPVLHGTMPPDFSRGEILVRYWPPLNDEEFDAILFGN